MIQFVCPSCSSTCSVDDRFSGRKLKCPKCGARVLHLKDREVKLLTAGSALPPKPASPPVPGAPPLTDATPEATAVLPHSVTELVTKSESKQNLYVGAGLLGFFSLIGIILGFVLSIKLLIVLPIAVDLTAVGIYLWLHTKKLRQKIDARKKPPATP